jgi:hypothetical protein
MRGIGVTFIKLCGMKNDHKILNLRVRQTDDRMPEAGAAGCEFRRTTRAGRS